MTWSYALSGSPKFFFQYFFVTFRIKSKFFKLALKHWITWYQTIIPSIGVRKKLGGGSIEFNHLCWMNSYVSLSKFTLFLIKNVKDFYSQKNGVVLCFPILPTKSKTIPDNIQKNKISENKKLKARNIRKLKGREKAADQLGTSWHKEQHSIEFLGSCLCFMYPRWGVKEAVKKEILKSTENNSPNRNLLSLAKGPG